MGFSNLDNTSGKDSASKKYALFIGDTVLVNEVNLGIFWILDKIGMDITNLENILYQVWDYGLSQINMGLCSNLDITSLTETQPARNTLSSSGILCLSMR